MRETDQVTDGSPDGVRRKRAWFLYVLPLFLAITVAGAKLAGAEPLRFVTVAPGIVHAAYRVSADDAEPFWGYAFKVDLDVAELRLVPAGGASPRRTVAEIAAPYPAVVAMNASFFDRDGRAMGLAIDDGRSTGGRRQQGWGALVVEGKKARIMLGSDMGDGLSPRLVVQGIPRLVVGGKVSRLKPQIAERSAVCADGSVVVLVVSTRAEAAAFARFLADSPEKGGLGCIDALNLDGGPSTQLVARLPGLELMVPGWGVPNALVVTPGKR